ncbi:MAG: preprotein translocase subunit SecE [Actinobacteria bacterium]|nr:preprotein translocase subunit SecE [Actinomycetota bacterium]
MAKEKAAETKKTAKSKTKEKTKTAPNKKTQAQKKKNGGLMNYLRDVRQELKRVSWPNRKEIYQSTLLVILVVGFFILFVGLVDQILIQIIKLMTASLTGGQ